MRSKYCKDRLCDRAGELIPLDDFPRNREAKDKEEMKSIAEQAEDIISSVVHCADREEGQGRCHVFLDYEDICQCGEVDLKRERMK